MTAGGKRASMADADADPLQVNSWFRRQNADALASRMAVPKSPRPSSEGICRRSLERGSAAGPTPASDRKRIASTSTTHTFLTSSTCILDLRMPTARVIATVSGQQSII
eukprot:6213559-Pleurochrysis_carterae.AAC.3